MRHSDDHRLRDAASRKRQPTGRFLLKAGTNFHSSVARSSSASAHLVFPDGSADRTFPAESVIRSSSNSASGEDCSGILNGGRRSCIGQGEISSDLPGPDLLAASKTAIRFFFPLGRNVLCNTHPVTVQKWSRNRPNSESPSQLSRPNKKPSPHIQRGFAN
jgi:hypothetical protein